MLKSGSDRECDVIIGPRIPITSTECFVTASTIPPTIPTIPTTTPTTTTDTTSRHTTYYALIGGQPQMRPMAGILSLLLSQFILVKLSSSWINKTL
jgi:hypothetical protein